MRRALRVGDGDELFVDSRFVVTPGFVLISNGEEVRSQAAPPLSCRSLNILPRHALVLDLASTIV